MAYNAYVMITGTRSRPKYRKDQEVLGQNYKTKNGDYVRCRITSVTTAWHSPIQYEHLYECRVTDANIMLELNEEGYGR